MLEYGSIDEIMEEIAKNQEIALVVKTKVVHKDLTVRGLYYGSHSCKRST